MDLSMYKEYPYIFDLLTSIKPFETPNLIVYFERKSGLDQRQVLNSAC